MRICLLGHNFRSDNGAGVFARRLLQGLEKGLGAEVVPISALQGGIPSERPILYPNMARLLFSLLRVRKIVKTCDVIHVLDAYPYGIVAALASLGLNKKIIVTAFGTGSLKALYHGRFPTRQIVAWVYRKAAAVTAISHFTRDTIRARVPHIKIQVITPGIDGEIRSENSSEEEVESFFDSEGTSYTIRDLHPYVLSVGALRHRKGYHISIRAFAKVAKKFPDVKYVIVGKEYGRAYREKTEYHVKRLHLEGRVIILNSVSNDSLLQRIYRGAELFCLFPLPSGYDVEGFGIVFLEAARAGLPIVAARTGGVEDAVQEGENAILAAVGDLRAYDDESRADSFSGAIREILENPALKERMKMASKTFAAHSKWETKIEEYLKIYRSL